MSYTDKSGTDGTGAQVLRYAVSYSICKEFSMRWNHIPITTIDDNPGDNFSGLEKKKQYLEKLNLKLRPDDSMQFSPPFQYTVKKILRFSQLEFMLRVCRLFNFIPPKISISLYQPQSYLSMLDYNLEYYFSAIRKKFHKAESNPSQIKIVVHIRGALRSNRRTSPAILHNILRKLQKELEVISREFTILIITDLPRFSHPWKVKEGNDPGTVQYWSDLGLINEMGYILLDSFDFETQFTDISNLSIERELDPIESWEMMSNADLLIGCDSSVSIIGGYLNESGIKLFPRGLNSTLPGTWFSYDNHLQESELDLTKILYALVALKVL